MRTSDQIAREKRIELGRPTKTVELGDRALKPLVPNGVRLVQRTDETPLDDAVLVCEGPCLTWTVHRRDFDGHPAWRCACCGTRRRWGL